MIRRGLARSPGQTVSLGQAAAGFTMLEMMVAVAIIGIVAAIGVPALLSQMSKVRLEAAANDVANLVRQTRLRAIRDNQQYTVEVNGDIVTGEVVFGGVQTTTYEMEFNNPPIEIYPGGGIADCQNRYDGTPDSWGGTSIVYEPTGKAQDTGAICVWDGEENILQILVDFPAGPPTVRKFLKTGHTPGGGAEGFYEKTSAATAGSTWVWY